MAGKSKGSTYANSLAERRRKQSIGNYLYSCYILCALYLLKLSFEGVLPKFSFDFIPYRDIEVYSKFMSANHHFPAMACLVYVVTIFTLKYMMEFREPYKLNMSLAAWSLGLAGFSLLGAIRTIPELYHLINVYGIFGFITEDTRKDWVLHEESNLNTWIFWFCLSKFPELVDTLFIVLKKNKLIFLHWYHHITVLLFCWNTFATMSLYGSIFSVMNFTVHAIMYFFYFLAALKYKPKGYAMLITTLQILQMVVGTLVCLYTLYHQVYVAQVDVVNFLNMNKGTRPSFKYKLSVDSSNNPKNNPANVTAGLLMYVSYFILFIAFFYESYLAPKRKTE